jgi:hypothetical protein
MVENVADAVSERRPYRRGGEMADTEDLKSSGAQAPCGFESRPRHHLFADSYAVFVGSNAQAVRPPANGIRL